VAPQALPGVTPPGRSQKGRAQSCKGVGPIATTQTRIQDESKHVGNSVLQGLFDDTLSKVTSSRTTEGKNTYVHTLSSTRVRGAGVGTSVTGRQGFFGALAAMTMR
jgi:hypothetical protein